MPKIITPKEAAALIPNGSRVMFGGFIGCGAAHETINAINESPITSIEGVFDDGSVVQGPDGSAYYA